MTRQLPLFPLQTVIFPGGILPLRIFEQRYLDMVTRAIADATPFGICAILQGQETGTPAVPCNVGTEVVVSDWDMPQPGILHIKTRALDRFVIRSTLIEANGLLVAAIDNMSAERSAPIPDDLALAREILRHIIDEVGAEQFPSPQELDNAVWVGYRLSEVLPLKLGVKQNLLEMKDSVTRLKILTEFLRKQIN